MLRTKTQSSKLPIHLELPAAAPSQGSLRQLLGPGVLAGCALGGASDDLNATELSLVLEQFSAVTPENCMKPGVIQPDEGHFHFQPADDLVVFAQENRLEVTGHCLAWHQQYPLWFFEDGDAPASRELVLDRLTRHIHTVMGRYRGRIHGWDVVNEAISDREGMLRQTPWTQIVGDDLSRRPFALPTRPIPRPSCTTTTSISNCPPNAKKHSNCFGNCWMPAFGSMALESRAIGS